MMHFEDNQKRQDIYFSTHRLGPGVPEEGLEVAPGEQLEDDEPGVLVEAHSDEVNDVGVVKLAHDQRLHEEVHLGLVGAKLGQRLHRHRHLRGVGEALLVEALVDFAEGALTQSPEKEKSEWLRHRLLSKVLRETRNLFFTLEGEGRK